MDWRSVVIIILVLWAIYHSVLDFRQDRRLDKLEEASGEK